MSAPPKRQLQPAVEAAESRLRSDVRALFGWAQRSKPAALLPRSLAHYDLLNKIGSGTEGAVYLAHDRRSGRCVAIKILRPYADPESRLRFRREADCASILNHPNIAAVYRFIHTQGTESIVMEYVPGRTLDRLMPERGLPLQTCLDYARQIAQALAAIHSAKMMHRDLKPANFVITKGGIVKLLDFGLAKVIEGSRKSLASPWNPERPKTREGTILGTVGYMAPEQVRGETADQRSDVFSFGAIFYEMLSGRRAFREKSPIETMNAILRKTPPKLPARIPAQIGRIVRRCLQKNPRRRYKTAQELIVDLAAAVR